MQGGAELIDDQHPAVPQGVEDRSAQGEPRHRPRGFVALAQVRPLPAVGEGQVVGDELAGQARVLRSGLLTRGTFGVRRFLGVPLHLLSERAEHSANLFRRLVLLDADAGDAGVSDPGEGDELVELESALDEQVDDPRQARPHLAVPDAVHVEALHEVPPDRREDLMVHFSGAREREFAPCDARQPTHSCDLPVLGALEEGSPPLLPDDFEALVPDPLGVGGESVDVAAVP